MAPVLLARSAAPAASRALLRASRTPALPRARFNSSNAPLDLNAVAAKARVVKNLPDFSMANKVRAPPLSLPHLCLLPPLLPLAYPSPPPRNRLPS